MAFEGLAEKLQATFKKLSGRGRLNEKDVKDAMREVRLALLEADVNYKVVKEFTSKVTERAVGSDILESLTPAQQVIKIVNEELVALMGSTHTKLTMSSDPPSVILMAGLQGAGKTTMCGKLANYLKKQGKKPLLVACDVYRPAAIQQLQVVGAQADTEVYQEGQGDPVQIAKNGLAYAIKKDYDPVIVDTAGRLHIDDDLMAELENIKKAVKPSEILLVVDAMTGQDAVNVAQTFNERLDVGGVVLTKLDGDTRGGAALSVRAVTGKPIKFAGVSEKLDGIEPFHPDRMASRILGMGDVLTLIEKAQAMVDEKKAVDLERKMRTQTFTLEDLLEQMEQMKNMGSMEEIMAMMPGGMGNMQVDEKQLGRTKAIIQAMTPKERRDPNILNASRRRRIAAGSGTSVQQVNQLIKQYDSMKKLMKQMQGMAKGGRFRRGGFKLPF